MQAELQLRQQLPYKAISEACGFKSPNPSIVKAKMVGNIIELNSPTAKIDHMDTKP